MTRDNHSRRRAARIYMAEHGARYTEAVRALDRVPADQAPTATTATGSTFASSTSSLTPRPYEQGPRLPAAFTREHDVNPICGHFLGNRCDGCGTCTTCDGCYCGELRLQAEEDAYRDQLDREHREHYGKPDRECTACELERTKSKDYTECPRCRRTLDGYGHYLDHHPPVCLPDKPHPRGLDWSHLIGKRITLNDDWRYHGDRAAYASTWTGTVVERHRNPRTGELTDYYVLELDPNVPNPRDDIDSTPFDPRDWVITEHPPFTDGPASAAR